MKTAKLFKNGQSQAVRLPKEFRFKGSSVYVKKHGEGVLLLPIENPWKPLFEAIKAFPSDFMESRDQPEQPDREDLS